MQLLEVSFFFLFFLAMFDNIDLKKGTKAVNYSKKQSEQSS
jgi:hypothetical protein